MGKLEIILPAMGEGIIEATITRWIIAEGKYVELDEPLLEVATDKVDSEIPAPMSGILSKIIYREGETPKIGEVLAILETEADTPEDSELLSDQTEITTDSENAVQDFQNNFDNSSNSKKSSYTANNSTNTADGFIFISPLIRQLAIAREIEFDELLKIKGSGLNGRLVMSDLNAYIMAGRPLKTNRNFNGIGLEVTENVNVPELEKYIPAPGEELIEMDRTRKLIAAHMVKSKRTSPHVTSMVEIDVTALVQWREANKEPFMAKHGVKLTYTPVVVMAAVYALKLFPGINISVHGDYIIKKSAINVGIATALPNGNLIVPVIKDSDQKNFGHIAKTLVDLADRARHGKLEPSEIKGGTFTITNLGQYENVSGTPIINQPEVAILAVGAIKKKPGVVNVNGQLTVGVRDILILSLTYDHRVVDGQLGGSFVRAIGHYLEKNIPEY